MKTNLALLLAFSAFATVASADSFDFKDPKGGNSIAFKLVAPKETISGSATDVSGTVLFDPANPGATKGKLVVESKSLTVPNAVMKGVMHGGMWLDVEKNPEITFEIKELKNAKTEGEKISGDAFGTFTLKGTARDITIPVTLSYLKDKLGDRIPGKKGDLLVVRGTFSIQRSDFNVNPHKNEDKVSDTIELTIGVAGAAVK
jgi:polyisoprenoid-binding protein YceI